jgi:hypothetical protein
MDSAMYNFPPSGVSRRGTSAYSSIPWAASRAADWTPDVDADSAWTPDVDADSVDAYSVGDGPPAVGPLPDNVIGGDIGSVAASFDGGYDHGDVPGNIFTD